MDRDAFQRYAADVKMNCEQTAARLARRRPARPVHPSPSSTLPGTPVSASSGQEDDDDDEDEVEGKATDPRDMSLHKLLKKVKQIAPKAVGAPLYPDDYAATLKLVVLGPSGAGKSACELYSPFFWTPFPILWHCYFPWQAPPVSSSSSG